MGDLISKAKALGIKFDPEEESFLTTLSRLHELLEEAERQRRYLEEAGEDTTKEDIAIPKIRGAIRDLAKKSR